MLKSIEETKKLFMVTGIEDGQVNIETSPYLLSLSESQQIKTLTKHLEYLKADLVKHESSSVKSPDGNDDIIRTQLTLLIQVIEDLLSQI